AIVTKLQQHGVKVDELREDIELDVEAYKVDAVRQTVAARYEGNFRTALLQVTPRKEPRRIEAGTILVRTAQPLGDLAAYLLEPQSADGLATWDLFKDALKEGQDFPVLRLVEKVPVISGPVRPLAEDRQTGKAITVQAVY